MAIHDGLVDVCEDHVVGHAVDGVCGRPAAADFQFAKYDIEVFADTEEVFQVVDVAVNVCVYFLLSLHSWRHSVQYLLDGFSGYGRPAADVVGLVHFADVADADNYRDADIVEYVDGIAVDDGLVAACRLFCPYLSTALATTLPVPLTQASAATP
jgi:hypothetical protein